MLTQVSKDTIPLYSRVATSIQNKIFSGQYEPGERLPTEDEMVINYGVSKITIRNAMSMLEADGLIIRSRGRGTFVAESIPEARKVIHTDLKEILASITDSRIKPLDINPLPIGECRIPKDICNFFGMTNGEIIGRIQRVANRQGVTSFFESYMMPDIAGHITKKELARKKSVQGILKEKIGLRISKAEMYLQAVSAEQDISNILQCETFEPLVHIQTLFWDESGQPFEIVNHYQRARNFRYKMNLDLS